MMNPPVKSPVMNVLPPIVLRGLLSSSWLTAFKVAAAVHCHILFPLNTLSSIP